MSIMTVNGAISAKEAGIITAHEHLFIDITNQAPHHDEISKRRRLKEKVNILNLDVLSRNPYAVLDNLLLDDEEVAVKELNYFKDAGGGTFVDVTPIGIGRDPEALRRASNRSGVHIVAGCGFYTGDTHPAFVNKMDSHAIADLFLEEIQDGIPGTDIKVGVIGEIGTSARIEENERKVLIAAGIAQVKSGLGVHVHTYPWGNRGLEALDILKEQGADLGKVAINHVDVDIDIDYCIELMDRGAFIEFDNFGKEFYINRVDRKDFAGGPFMTDVDRVRALKILVDKGYASHILLTNDVCLKTLIHTYGGWGYDHVLVNIYSMMQDLGISQNDIDKMINDNPVRFLDS